MRPAPGLLFVLLLALSACSAPGTSGTDEDDRNVITRERIEAAGGSPSNAYQIVQRFEPQWLRKRSGGITTNQYQEEMEGDVVVYIDGTRMGGPEALRQIRPEQVATIRHLGTAEATRLGTGHQHGAILVTTR